MAHQSPPPEYPMIIDGELARTSDAYKAFSQLYQFGHPKEQVPPKDSREFKEWKEGQDELLSTLNSMANRHPTIDPNQIVGATV